MRRKPRQSALIKTLAGGLLSCGVFAPALAQADHEAAQDGTAGTPTVDGSRDAEAGEAGESGTSTSGVTPTPDGASNGRGFSDQIMLITELASAYRLRNELETVLSDDGTASAQGGVTIESRLSGLSTRCEVLANSVVNAPARLVLLECQARAIAALTQLQGAEEARQRQLHQLRVAAEKIRTLKLPGAEGSADYWLLLADLADAGRLSATVQARQTLAQELLAGYLRAYADEQAASDYVIDARLALARLLDDHGDQAGVAAQLEAIGELPANSPRAEQAEQLRASVKRIGTKPRIEALTTRVTVWKLSDFVGQPVLLHIYADTLEHSVAMIQPIRRAIAEGRLGGAAVASLRVGDPVEGTTAAPWPTLPIDLEPGGVLDQLGIMSLPALVWIDQDGRVASIGHTAATLARMPATKKSAPPEPSDEPSEPSDPPRNEAEPAPAEPAQPTAVRGGTGEEG